MGIRENSITLQIRDYLIKAGFDKDFIWRNQVLKGSFKGYHINQGIDGLPDYSVPFPDGKTLYIEVKTPTGKRRQSQIDFADKCMAWDIPYVLAQSDMDVSSYLRDYFSGTKWKNKFNYLDN